MLEGIQAIIWDFDCTFLQTHTRGSPMTPTDVQKGKSTPVSTYAKQLFQHAYRLKLCQGFASFADNRLAKNGQIQGWELIQKVLHREGLDRAVPIIALNPANYQKLDKKEDQKALETHCLHLKQNHIRLKTEYLHQGKRMHYETLSHFWKLPPSNILVIDDSIENIKVAYALGYNVIHVKGKGLTRNDILQRSQRV